MTTTLRISHQAMAFHRVRFDQMFIVHAKEKPKRQ
tara:strand:- start:869 stop:973 length:105 start_codon:yes stop_codon:yes gene_type:complete